MMEAMSPTVFVSIPKTATIPNTTRIAASDAGTALVSLGKPHMMSIVSKTRPRSTYRDIPVSQDPDISLNWSSCDMNIIMASPLTNPKITGWGTSRINLPSFNKPAAA